jgi:DNA transformation protein
MSEVGRLRNLGPVSERMLNAIGVHTAAELRDLGAVNAYRLLALRGHRPSLNLVWAIEAALTDVHWMDLPPETKARLKAELEAPWDARALLEGDEEDGEEDREENREG